MSFYNGRLNMNKRYVPNVRYILDRLTKQEDKMKEKKCDHDEYFTTNGICTKCSIAEHVQGDVEIFEEVGKEDPREIYKDDLEGIEVGPRCPTCDLNTQFHNGVETCPVHGPVVIEN